MSLTQSKMRPTRLKETGEEGLNRNSDCENLRRPGGGRGGRRRAREGSGKGARGVRAPGLLTSGFGRWPCRVPPSPGAARAGSKLPPRGGPGSCGEPGVRAWERRVPAGDRDQETRLGSRERCREGAAEGRETQRPKRPP